MAELKKKALFNEHGDVDVTSITGSILGFQTGTDRQ